MGQLDINAIKQLRLAENQYMPEEFKKTQIVIHHTAGGPSPINAITGWNANEERVGTAFVIAGKPSSATSNYKDGEIYQCFSSKHWAHHLGLKAVHLTSGGKSNTALNQGSIGIEVSNWGYLTKAADGTFRTYVNTVVPADQVYTYTTPFKGHIYYQKYTAAQIESLRQLLVYLCDKYGIPKTYNADMWDISKPALKGNPGIYTHVSYRPDKTDMHPQAELVNMLKSL